MYLPYCENASERACDVYRVIDEFSREGKFWDAWIESRCVVTGCDGIIYEWVGDVDNSEQPFQILPPP
jgi:hypothetical protein